MREKTYLRKNSRSKWILRRILCFLLICMLMGSQTMIGQAAGSEATEQTTGGETAEQAATQVTRPTHRTVRVGCALSTGYHQMTEQGDLSGYGYSYEKLMAQYAGWDIEYVEGNWAELQQLLTDGEIDLLGFLVDTPERQELYDFTELSAGTSMSCLATRKDDARFSYQDYDSFEGMMVGCIGSNANWDSFTAYAQNNGFSVNITYFETYPEIFQAIDDGTVDAGLVTNFQELTDYSIIDQFLPVNFYYAVTRGNEELLREVNQALTEINTFYPDITSSLYNQYYDIRNGMNVAFSKEEQDYLKTKPVVKVVPCGRKLPYEEYDATTDTYIGMIPELFEQISELTGITFEYVQTEDRWLFEKESLGTNVVTCFSYDLDWAQSHGLYITQPLLESTVSVIQKEIPTQDVTVALVKGIYLEQIALTQHPEWKVQYYTNTEECLEKVKDGTCSCTLLNSYEADYYLSMGRYHSLKEETMAGVLQNICLGITYSSDELLPSVLSKAIMLLPSDRVDAIVRTNANATTKTTWVDFIYTNPVQVSLITFLLLAMVLLSISLLFYIRFIRRKNQEVMSANQAKSDFLARVSHDLRTPMNAIINLTNIVEDEIEDKEAALKDISKIKTSNQFLLSLINDVLDVTKMENKQMELHPEVYGYGEFLDYIHSTFEPLCQEKQIELTVQKGIQDVDILMDKVRFNQLCFNLLSNAIKYTPKGGQVAFRMLHGEIIDGKLPCDIVVEDDGIGMSREFQEKMCEPFSQEGRSFKTVEGTGLGLYIVKQIVDLLQGTLVVESEVGKGTTITVHILMELAEPSDEKTEQTFDTGTGGKTEDFTSLAGLHILVAEDHPINQEIARKLLEKVGIETTLVENGKEAVELFTIKEQTFDGILMDIRMPVMDGIQATQEIRNLGTAEGEQIPIIAMTANAYDEDVKKSLDAGMNAHLAKPIEPKKLYAALLKYCSKEPEN